MLAQVDYLLRFLENKKSVLVLTIALFALTFITSLINIAFRVNIGKLETNIDRLSEEKANLRAQYLSEISLGNLSIRADEMEMQQASHHNIHRVSSADAKQEISELRRRSKPQASTKILLSGY